MSFLPKLKGSFFKREIFPALIPEISMSLLVTLGALVNQTNQQKMYRHLHDSLRKIQWVKFVGLRAISVEREINREVKPGYAMMHPLGQIDHALCITDCVVHTKSALDSMAVFLTSFLKLSAKGGKRDLKLPTFRELVSENDKVLGKKIKQLESWLNYLQEIRDEWIHRSSLSSVIVYGSSEVGLLPVPRKAGYLRRQSQVRLKVNRRNYRSTEDYVDYHYKKLIDLFQVIVRRCIENEEKLLEKPFEPADTSEEKMMIFPTVVMQKGTISGITMAPISISKYFDRYW